MKKDNWFYVPLLAMLFFMALVFWASLAFAMDVTLQWDANTESDLAGYEIFYDINSGHPYEGTGAEEGNSPVNVTFAMDENPDPALVEFTLHGLPYAEQVYYLALKAYDNAELYSGYSNEVNTMAPDAPGLRIIQVIIAANISINIQPYAAAK